MDVLLYVGVLLLVVVSIIYYLTRPRGKHTADVLKMWPIGVQPSLVSVPGLPKTDPNSGNMPDIVKSGGMQGFLKQLHAKYGDIASFWWGRYHSVAICSPELFGKVAHLFERPAISLAVLEPLFTKDNLSFVNLKEGRERRALYEKILAPGLRKFHYSIVQEVVDDMANRLADLPPEQHLDIRQCIFEVVFQANVLLNFGIPFGNSQELKTLHKSFFELSDQMEAMTFLGFPDEKSQGMKKYVKVREILFGTVERAMQHRRENPPAQGEELFVDVLMNSGLSKEVIVGDGVAQMFAGSLEVLSFCFTFLAANPDVQDRVHDELVKVLGRKNVTPENMKKLIYTRQVVDETLRIVPVVVYVGRYSTEAFELGGYTIPAMTPIVLSLAKCLLDEKRWPGPTRFDPDHFSPENRKKIPKYAFEPFGVGVRKCPVGHFACTVSVIVIATLVREFIFKPISSDASENTLSMFTHPEETLWLAIEKRV